MVLSSIIPGPRLVTSEHFDTYLKPLVKDLKMLWEVGINVRDAGWFRGEPTFNMCAILLWTMYDLLSFGMVTGCTTKGYWSCHCCALGTISRRSIPCHKIVYCSQHRRWLPNDHVYYRDIRAFGGVEEGTPPLWMSVDDIIVVASTREAWLEVGQPMRCDPTTIFGIKRLNILFRLEYWKLRPLHWMPT